LYALAQRLPPLLEGKSAREMPLIIKAEVRKLHGNYSRQGRFCHPGDVSIIERFKEGLDSDRATNDPTQG
jgi:hypothetical protein